MTSDAFPLSTTPVTLSGKKISLLWHDCSWQFHVGCYTCSYYLPGAYKEFGYLFQYFPMNWREADWLTVVRLAFFFKILCKGRHYTGPFLGLSVYPLSFLSSQSLALMTLRFPFNSISTGGWSSLDSVCLKTSTLPKYSDYCALPVWGSNLALCQWY